jgi:hypothetical protein
MDATRRARRTLTTGMQVLLAQLGSSSLELVEVQISAHANHPRLVW